MNSLYDLGLKQFQYAQSKYNRLSRPTRCALKGMALGLGVGAVLGNGFGLFNKDNMRTVIKNSLGYTAIWGIPSTIIGAFYGAVTKDTQKIDKIEKPKDRGAFYGAVTKDTQKIVDSKKAMPPPIRQQTPENALQRRPAAPAIPAPPAAPPPAAAIPAPPPPPALTTQDLEDLKYLEALLATPPIQQQTPAAAAVASTKQELSSITNNAKLEVKEFQQLEQQREENFNTLKHNLSSICSEFNEASPIVKSWKRVANNFNINHYMFWTDQQKTEVQELLEKYDSIEKKKTRSQKASALFNKISNINYDLSPS